MNGRFFDSCYSSHNVSLEKGKAQIQAHCDRDREGIPTARMTILFKHKGQAISSKEEEKLTQPITQGKTQFEKE
jgi:hypothetical protein